MVKMKPEQWRLDLYQDLFAFAPFNSDLAREFVAVEMDEVPEADENGRRRVGGYKLTFEGVVRKGERESISELDDVQVLSERARSHSMDALERGPDLGWKDGRLQAPCHSIF